MKCDDRISKGPGFFFTPGKRIQDGSGNFGDMPKGKDLKRNSIEAQAGKTIYFS
jgi:hypothetical protein